MFKKIAVISNILVGNDVKKQRRWGKLVHVTVRVVEFTSVLDLTVRVVEFTIVLDLTVRVVELTIVLDLTVRVVEFTIVLDLTVCVVELTNVFVQITMFKKIAVISNILVGNDVKKQRRLGKLVHVTSEISTGNRRNRYFIF
jgi:hypothetical protein